MRQDNHSVASAQIQRICKDAHLYSTSVRINEHMEGQLVSYIYFIGIQYGAFNDINFPCTIGKDCINDREVAATMKQAAKQHARVSFDTNASKDTHQQAAVSVMDTISTIDLTRENPSEGEGLRRSSTFIRESSNGSPSRNILNGSPSIQLSKDRSSFLRTIFLKERKEVVSNLRNAPSYTIKNKRITYKQVISKVHVQDMIGKDAPGVGVYNIDKYNEVAVQKSPSFPIPQAERFEAVTKFNQFKVSNNLGYYQGPDYKQLTEKKVTFPRAERFKHFDKFNLYQMMPGPGEYNVPGTIESPDSLKGKQALFQQSIYQVDREKRRQVYFPEYDKEFHAKQTPGPGEYRYEKWVSSFNKNKGSAQKFMRAQRKLSNDKSDIELPVSYSNGEDSLKLLQQSSFIMGSTFTRASRNLSSSKGQLHTIIY